MPITLSYPSLSDEIKATLSMEKALDPRSGLTTDQIVAKVQKMYLVKDAPSRTTIARRCYDMEARGEIQHGKRGYYLNIKNIPFEEFWHNRIPGLSDQIFHLVLLMMIDPEDNAEDARDELVKVLFPVVEKIRMVIQFMDLIKADPKFVAWSARNNKLFRDRLDQLKEAGDLDDVQKLWDVTDAFGEFVITTSGKENA